MTPPCLIVAVTREWGIGRAGKLLCSLPEDMAFFREKTRGAALLMGRATLDSLPGGRPLPGRLNVVLTREADLARPGVRAVHTLAQAAQALHEAGAPAFVIGGEQIYRLLLPYCRWAYVTQMDLSLPADRFFPDLDAAEGWYAAQVGPWQHSEKGGTPYRFCTYENRAPLPLPEARPATQVVAALLWREGRFLACQRPPHKARGGLWEFVGGKVEPGEDPKDALARECREELALPIAVQDVYMCVNHTYPDMTVCLTLYNARALGEPQALEHTALRWVTPQEAMAMPFCPADAPILERLCADGAPR